MSDYRAYERWQYRIDETLVGEDEPESNQLLDEDGLARSFQNPRHAGLAAIAEALDKHAEHLLPDDLEKAVWWFKDWQMGRVGWYRRNDAAFQYAQAMRDLKETRDFRRFEKRARRYILGSHFAAAAAVALLAGVVATWSDPGWWVLAWGLGTLVMLGLASGWRDSAGHEWQVQDRQYFLGCLRKAECVEDLMDAGLFAYHDDTMQLQDRKRSRVAMLRMQRQLATALYFDHDRLIREDFVEYFSAAHKAVTPSPA
jgi:hypothetical protein